MSNEQSSRLSSNSNNTVMLSLTESVGTLKEEEEEEYISLSRSSRLSSNSNNGGGDASGGTNADTHFEEEDFDSREEDVSLHSGDNLNYLVNTVYYRWIVEHVKFSELISKMPFMRGIAGRIYSLDSEGKTKEAGELFLTELRNKEDPGKYPTLLFALKELGYISIVDAVVNGVVNENHEEHKKILDIFMDPILATIDPSVIANVLYEKKVISFGELDRILKTSESKSKHWAAFELLDAIPRKHPKWYDIFWGVLYDQGHRQLSREIDPKLYGLREADENPYGHSTEPAIDSLLGDVSLESIRIQLEQHEESDPLPVFNASLLPEEATPETLFSFGQSGSPPVLRASGSSPTENNNSNNDSDNKHNNSNSCMCNCSCARDVNEKVEELKTFFEMKINVLESKINDQCQLLERLLNK